MGILDSQSMKGLIVIALIVWAFSAGGIKTIQKVIEDIIDELG